jgi:hypothetical protein
VELVSHNNVVIPFILVFHILQDMVNETNHYVVLCTNEGVFLGGGVWDLFTVVEFKA